MADLAFYQYLLSHLQTEPVVVATVIATQGQVPREVGAKMLIWGDAETYNTLADREGDTEVIQQAFEVLKTGIPQRLPLELTAALGNGPGNLQVWLGRWQGRDAIATTQTILKTLSDGTPGRLVIPLTTGQAPYVLIADELSLRNLQGQEVYIEVLTP